MASLQQRKRWDSDWGSLANPASLKAATPDNEIPDDWEPWLRGLFPEYFSDPFSPHHRELWDWVWSIEKGVRPPPFVAIWPRGGGKSTNAEAACVAIAARNMRSYGIYVSETQDQADDHVATVAAMLESDTVARGHPALSDRLLGKFGQAKGWRRNRLRTASGFTLDALGLDKAARGIKIEADRPGLLIFDDIDGENDTPPVIDKKVRTLTRKLLPAAAQDAAVLAVQNLVHGESIFARLAGVASEQADFLADRIVSGPHKAVLGLQYEQQGARTIVTGGTPTWAGMGLERVQEMIDRDGLRAFLAESQHEETREGQAFADFDRAAHVIAPFRVPAEWPRWRGIDFGYGVPMCCLWATRSPSGITYVYRELYGAGMLASDQALKIRALSAGEAFRRSWADPSMWAAKHNGLSVRSMAAEYLEYLAISPGNNQRIAGRQLLHRLLAWVPASGKQPAFPPRLQIFNTCTNLVRTMPQLLVDPNNPDDVDTDSEDHAYDALRYLLMGMYVSPTKPPPDRQPYRLGGNR